jgi:hypothetical protein
MKHLKALSQEEFRQALTVGFKINIEVEDNLIAITINTKDKRTLYLYAGNESATIDGKRSFVQEWIKD